MNLTKIGPKVIRPGALEGADGVAATFDTAGVAGTTAAEAEGAEGAFKTASSSCFVFPNSESNSQLQDLFTCRSLEFCVYLLKNLIILVVCSRLHVKELLLIPIDPVQIIHTS